MTRTTIPLIILYLSSFLISCQGQQESQLPDYLVINDGNYRKNIERVRQGWSAQSPLTAKEHLEHLLIFIQDPSIKKKHYKNDAGAWLYDVSMTQLMRAEYLNSFRTFKEYMRITDDYVRPFFHIGFALKKSQRHSGIFSLKMCLRELINRTDMSILSVNDTINLVGIIDTDYIVYTKDREIDPRIVNSQEYKQAYIYYENVKEKFNRNPYDFVIYPGTYEFVSHDFLQGIESKQELPEIEIDYLIRYYTNALTSNYKKASYYADKKDWNKIEGSDPEYVLSRMMISYLNTDRYRDVISLYSQNQDLLRERRISEYYIYLWVGAAYAGLDDYENAKKYLELALEVTTLEDGYHVSYDEKGSVLFVIFNLVFFTDEYDRFEEIGRYDEIERIVENSMTRFKHLRLFQ